MNLYNKNEKIAKFEIKKQYMLNILRIGHCWTLYSGIATTVTDLTTRPVYACFAIPL